MLQMIVGWVKEVAKIPVLVKLTPNIGDILVPGGRAVKGGADGLSLINTIKSIIGVDLDQIVPYPVVGGKRHQRRLLRPGGQADRAAHGGSTARATPTVNMPISGIGGIATWRDAAGVHRARRDRVQVCTAVMHYGFRIVEDMIEGLSHYLDEKGMKSVEDFAARRCRTSAVGRPRPQLQGRGRASTQSKCIGCHLCYVACEDGAHQAIALCSEPASRFPRSSTRSASAATCARSCARWRTASPWSAAMTGSNTSPGVSGPQQGTSRRPSMTHWQAGFTIGCRNLRRHWRRRSRGTIRVEKRPNNGIRCSRDLLASWFLVWHGRMEASAPVVSSVRWRYALYSLHCSGTLSSICFR